MFCRVDIGKNNNLLIKNNFAFKLGVGKTMNILWEIIINVLNLRLWAQAISQVFAYSLLEKSKPAVMHTDYVSQLWFRQESDHRPKSVTHPLTRRLGPHEEVGSIRVYALCWGVHAPPSWFLAGASPGNWIQGFSSPRTNGFSCLGNTVKSPRPSQAGGKWDHTALLS